MKYPLYEKLASLPPWGGTAIGTGAGAILGGGYGLATNWEDPETRWREAGRRGAQGALLGLGLGGMVDVLRSPHARGVESAGDQGLEFVPVAPVPRGQPTAEEQRARVERAQARIRAGIAERQAARRAGQGDAIRTNADKIIAQTYPALASNDLTKLSGWGLSPEAFGAALLDKNHVWSF